MKKLGFAALAFVLIIAEPATTRAELVLNLYQSGNNVILSGSGTLNISGLTSEYTGTIVDGRIAPIAGVAVVGYGTSSVSVYALTSSPAFGSGTYHGASSGSGSTFGASLYGAGSGIFLPSDYTSGTYISGTSTYDNVTLADLGASIGTYTDTLAGTGDTLVLKVGVAAVPEPSSAVMVATAALTGLGAWAWRRRRSRRGEARG